MRNKRRIAPEKRWFCIYLRLFAPWNMMFCWKTPMYFSIGGIDGLQLWRKELIGVYKNAFKLMNFVSLTMSRCSYTGSSPAQLDCWWYVPEISYVFVVSRSRAAPRWSCSKQASPRYCELQHKKWPYLLRILHWKCRSRLLTDDFVIAGNSRCGARRLRGERPGLARGCVRDWQCKYRSPDPPRVFYVIREAASRGKTPPAAWPWCSWWGGLCLQAIPSHGVLLLRLSYSPQYRREDLW